MFVIADFLSDFLHATGPISIPEHLRIKKKGVNSFCLCEFFLKWKGIDWQSFLRQGRVVEGFPQILGG